MTVTLKRGDTRRGIDAKLKHPNGTYVDLTDATVTFAMKKRNTSTLLINREAEIIDALNGQVLFVFVAGETDLTGLASAEFHVEYSDGSTETFPNSGYIDINFVQALT